jgi:hypothetical protein
MPGEDFHLSVMAPLQAHPPGRAARGRAGRRPPPGGLPYGREHCGEIRGIREIRGHDQPGLWQPLASHSSGRARGSSV